VTRHTSGFLTRLIALIRKETRQMLRDRSNLMVGLLLPAALILLFGYGLSFDVRDAPVAVVLEDRSETARDAVAGLSGSPYLAPVAAPDMGRAVACCARIPSMPSFASRSISPRARPLAKGGYRSCSTAMTRPRR
jgi:ABC-2 type transport system permease protein